MLSLPLGKSRGGRKGGREGGREKRSKGVRNRECECVTGESEAEILFSQSDADNNDKTVQDSVERRVEERRGYRG